MMRAVGGLLQPQMMRTGRMVDERCRLFSSYAGDGRSGRLLAYDRFSHAEALRRRGTFGQAETKGGGGVEEGVDGVGVVLSGDSDEVMWDAFERIAGRGFLRLSRTFEMCGSTFVVHAARARSVVLSVVT